MSRIKNYCNIYTGNSISDSEKDKFVYTDGSIPYISTKDINAYNHIIDYDNGMYVDLSKNQFKIAPENSVLLCIEGGSAGKKIGFIDKKVCFVNKLCCFSDFEGNPKFLYYYLQSDSFLSEFYLNMTGLIGGVSQSIIKNIRINFPTIEKQSIIANYLDKKCSKIDETIEDNNKEIELLEEYKLNIIDDEINKITNISEIIRLRYLGNFINGISASSEKFNTGNGIFINYGDVYNNYVIPDNPNGRIDLTEKEKEIYSLKKGDILFTRTSETIEEVGYSAVCLKDYDNSAFSGFVIRFRSIDIYELNPNFYKYYFKSRRHREFFSNNLNLVTRASLSQNLLGNIRVVVPSAKIQENVANKLDNKFSKINKVIEYRKQIIEKLEEYKKSLIYECVTGKKEVN